MFKKIVFFLVVVCLGFTIQGQTEDEVQLQANKLFKEEKFIEATPLYLRLLSLKPKNVSYNYRYGACLLFNSNKKQESLRYLKFATESSTIEPEAHYYMGRAYHLNYLFNDAVRSYEKFSELIDKKEVEKLNVPRLIEMCQDGRSLLSNYSELIVYEKKEIEADKFFRLYDLKDFGGDILVTADFQTKVDKKKNHTPLVYFPKSATEIYYSSYGETEENGKEIYRRLRKPSGGWDEPQLVKGDVNTKYDEDFAYKSQDGKYLYFSSKGHNSMGGFDVFRCAYNASTDSYAEAENLDFAISSPDDDVFFLVDKNNENGYFASARQSETGKLFVYKIRVEKLPVQLSIIAGKFESKIKPSSTQVQVEVRDGNTDAIVGNFQSDESGKIIITFPGGGQYKYVMKLADDAQIFTQNVSIPMKKNIKPLRQNIVHFMENGTEVIRILDRFDETVIEKDDILAELFLDKAALEPNAQNFNIEELQLVSNQKQVLDKIGAPNLTLAEVGTNLQNNLAAITKIENQSKEYQQKTANQIEKEIKNISEIDKKLAKNASAFKTAGDNTMTRENLIEDSKVLLSDREKALKKIDNLVSINQKVQENLKEYQEIKEQSLEWNKKGEVINTLLAADKDGEALLYISQNAESIKPGMNVQIEQFQDKNSLEIANLNVELTELAKKKYNYETSSKDMQNNIDFLEKSLYDGKANYPESVKENIALKKNDIKVISKEIQNINKELEEKREYKNTLVDELSEYMAIESSGTPANTIAFAEVTSRIIALKNADNSKELGDLAMEISRKENQDIAVTNPNPENPAKEPFSKSESEWVASLNPTYEKSKEDITKQGNLSNYEKAESLLNLERENAAIFKTQLQENEKLLKDSPNDKTLQQDNLTLTKLVENSNSELVSYNNQFEIEKSNLAANNLTEATIIKSIDKTYEDLAKFIENDIAGGELLKLKSLNQHDQKFVSKIDTRLNEVQEKLNEIPIDKVVLEKEMQLLTELKDRKMDEMENREISISNLENQLALNSTTQNENKETPKVDFDQISEEQQEQVILQSVDASYSERINEIENSTVSDIQKWNQQIIESESLLEKLELEKIELSPTVNKAQLAAIERLESNLFDKIKFNQINIKTAPEESSLLIARIAGNYENDKNTILSNNSIEPIEKEKQLIAIHSELIEKLSAEKSIFEELEKKNPTNPTIQAKIEEIDQIQSEVQQELAANAQKLAELENATSVAVTDEIPPKTNEFSKLNLAQQEEEIVKKINPSFDQIQQTIEASNSSEKEKLLSKISAQKVLVNQLVEEKEKLNKITQEPEIEAIKRVENKLNEEISNNQLSLLAVPESESELITRLAKDYLKNKELLTSNQNIDAKEKAKRQLGVDELLVDALVKEKQKFASLNEANPQISNLRAKELFLQSVIDNKQKEIEELKTTINSVVAANNESISTKYKVIDDLRSEFLGESNYQVLESSLEEKSIDQLKSELEKLESYESNLKTLELDLKNREIEKSENHQTELKLIASELISVETKKRQYTITIGELEKVLVAQNPDLELSQSNNETVASSDAQLERIAKEENALIAKLDGEITSIKEIKKIEKQLVKLSDQKTERATELLEIENNQLQKQNTAYLETLKSIPTKTVSERLNIELAETQANQLSKESEMLEQQARDSKSIYEAKQLMDKALAKQKQASELIEMALIDKKVATLTEGKVTTLSTLGELEQRKALLLMEESNYTSEIKNLDIEIKATNKDSDAEQLFEKRAELISEKNMVLDQIALLDKKLSKISKPVEKTINPEKKETPLTYSEEVVIASSLDYKRISRTANDAMFIENEISFVQKSIDKEKQIVRQLIEDNLLETDEKTQELIDSQIKSIQDKEARLYGLRMTLDDKKALLAKQMPADPEKSAKIENLLLRGIDPVLSSSSDYVPIPKDGFSVDAKTQAAEKKDLTIESKAPTGLLFRVQVGAFSKPVVNDAFQEFSPVTGEKRASGLIVYMAGYFDKSTSASEAQKTIRSLGYSDAFVVAYCDGERITLAEGRRMEAMKSCTPIELTDLTINRPVPQAPKDTTKLITRELDYNRALGAAPAFPVELKKGLFYTVQIGVYNRPVDLGTIKNMTPLITKRLPNGQIRYSAGVYVSIEEAMPKRQEAIEKGIQDAFITAYYGSERISLTEAENLLREQGNGIIEKTALGIVKDIQQRQVAEEKLQEAITLVEKKKFEEGMGIQLVSKQQFNEFPRDVLNRFNKHTSFYFDQNDKRLKSIVFKKIDDIPQIHFLRDEVDTVFVAEVERIQKADEKGYKKIVFTVQNGNLEGDVADYLFRLNFRKEFLDQGEKMKVILHDVPSNSIQSISDQLRMLKIRSSVE